MGNVVTDIVIWIVVAVAVVSFVVVAVLRWRGRPLTGDTPDPGAEAERPDQRTRPGAEYRPIADTKATGGGGLGL
jgi:hypothetical protein